MRGLIILSSIFFIVLSVNGQIDSTVTRNIRCDTLSQKEFFKIADRNLVAMKKNKKFSIQEMMTLVRVYTTLHFAEYVNQYKKRENFIKLFDERYRISILNTLECFPVSGVEYSEKYGLFIGPAYKIKCYNYFTVDIKNKVVPHFTR